MRLETLFVLIIMYKHLLSKKAALTAAAILLSSCYGLGDQSAVGFSAMISPSPFPLSGFIAASPLVRRVEPHKIIDSPVLSSFVSSCSAKLTAGNLRVFVIAPSFTHEFHNFKMSPILFKEFFFAFARDYPSRSSC